MNPKISFHILFMLYDYLQQGTHTHARYNLFDFIEEKKKEDGSTVPIFTSPE